MIRSAKPSEIVRLLAITSACARKMDEDGIFQWNSTYPNKEAFVKDLQRDELYVLIIAQTIVGCITISTKKDIEYEAIDWLTEDTNNLYIHRLAVHPAFQGRGYAKQLMDFAETYAKNRDAVSIRLDTFSKNKQNLQFYEARGYQRLGDVYFPRQTDFPFHCYELVLHRNNS